VKPVERKRDRKKGTVFRKKGESKNGALIKESSVLEGRGPVQGERLTNL